MRKFTGEECFVFRVFTSLYSWWSENAPHNYSVYDAWFVSVGMDTMPAALRTYDRAADIIIRWLKGTDSDKFLHPRSEPKRGYANEEEWRLFLSFIDVYMWWMPNKCHTREVWDWYMEGTEILTILKAFDKTADIMLSFLKKEALYTPLAQMELVQPNPMEAYWEKATCDKLNEMYREMTTEG